MWTFTCLAWTPPLKRFFFHTLTEIQVTSNVFLASIMCFTTHQIILIFSRESDSRIANVLGWCGYIKSWVWLYSVCLSVTKTPQPLRIMPKPNLSSQPISLYTNQPSYYLATMPLPPKPLKIITIGHHVYQPSWHSTIKPIGSLSAIMSISHCAYQPSDLFSQLLSLSAFFQLQKWL